MKSVYDFLEKDMLGSKNKLIYSVKLPLKIHIFYVSDFS
jgi:hypothetical protein